MKANASVGGRPSKKDRKHLRNWCGKLDMKATFEGDQFILAAIYRVLFGNDDECKRLRDALAAEAKRCQRDHVKAEEPQ